MMQASTAPMPKMRRSGFTTSMLRAIVAPTRGAAGGRGVNFASGTVFCFVLSAALPFVRCHANDTPAGWQAEHVEPIGYVATHGARAFKMSLKRSGPRWYLFVAQGPGPAGESGFSVVDVTEPAHPVERRFISVPGADGQLTLHDDLLIVGSQSVPYPSTGSIEYPFLGAPASTAQLATLWDLHDPENPRQLSSWSVPGWGTHRNTYPGGRYAFMSAWVPGYHGQSVLVILDVADSRRPVEAGRWSRPSQADDQTPIADLPMGFHGPVSLSADGRILTTGYSPGVINLDIRDVAHPKLIGELIFSPLAMTGTQAIHTVIPLSDGFIHVNTEVSSPGCDRESLPFAAIVDNHELARPRLIAYYPRPVPAPDASYKSFCQKEGRFGPHNVNAEIHLADVQKPGPLIYMTYFNAGLRVFDIHDPYMPREVGWFLPEIGKWSEGMRGPEDVLVDMRGNIFLTMGRQRGVWVLRHTSP